jgi:hypothetical protein
MTTTTPIETVIEQTSETTKAAGERLREFVQVGVRKATEGYDQISKAAQTASEQLNGRVIEAQESAAKAGLKLLEVAKEDSDATYAALRALLAVKSPLEAFDVSASYWRGRLETRLAHAQDLGAFVRKSAEEAFQPMRKRLDDFAKAAA